MKKNINKNNEVEVEKLVYSVKEVSKALNIGMNKTYELLKNGDIPSVRVGKRFIVPKEGVVMWLNKLSKIDHFQNMKNFEAAV